MAVVNSLEAGARQHWRAWSQWSKYTICAGCRSAEYCGARRRSGPYLCLSCFDTSRYAVVARRNGRNGRNG
jgi:hypothetical protein